MNRLISIIKLDYDIISGLTAAAMSVMIILKDPELQLLIKICLMMVLVLSSDNN